MSEWKDSQLPLSVWEQVFVDAFDSLMAKGLAYDEAEELAGRVADHMARLSARVFVTLGVGDDIKTVATFDTIAEAEEFIAEREEHDPENVAAGNYGIDAPGEGEVNLTRLPVVDGDTNADIYGFASTRDEALSFCTDWADGAVDAYVDGTIRCTNGLVIPMGWIVLSGAFGRGS